MAGAFNEFATGIGNTDAGFVLGTGKLLLKVPETMHFRLEGELQPGVMAKDIILHCIGEIGADGATYRAMQFDGPGAASLSMDDRMTVANMAIEAGGKNGIFGFDAQTQAYVDYRCKLNGTKEAYEPAAPGRKQKFVYELVLDLSKLEPTVACHPNPGERKLAKELGHIKLDRAYIGSCTGGKTSDFLEFARVLRGKRVTIDTFGVPATPEIVHDLQTARWGDQTLWQLLTEAGVQMTENAGCAACLGGPVDTFGRMNAGRDPALGSALLAQPEAATALAADLLGSGCLHRVRHCPVSPGGHRVCCPAGIDPHPGVCLPVFRHPQQFAPAGINPDHQLRAGFSGDADFILCGVPVPDPLQVGLASLRATGLQLPGHIYLPRPPGRFPGLRAP